MAASVGAGAGAAPLSPFRTVLLSNAANLGRIERAGSVSGGLATFRADMDLNATGALWLTKRFLAFVAGLPHPPAAPPVVVNVSSLAALLPFPSMSAYCFAKAGRDMFSRVVAAEHPAGAAAAAGGRVLALNWAPGPMETDMNLEIMACDRTDEAIRAAFAETKAKVVAVAALMPRVLALRCVAVRCVGCVCGCGVDVGPAPLGVGGKRVSGGCACEERQCAVRLPICGACRPRRCSQNSFVDPAHSAHLCVGLVLSGEFESGAHVDYYDLAPKA